MLFNLLSIDDLKSFVKVNWMSDEKIARRL